MKAISAAVFSTLFCTVLSAAGKVKEEHRMAFFGEDVHINVPSDNFGEVVFRSRSKPSSEVVLLQAGRVRNPRGRLNKLGHLVLEDVREEDEGMYVIKNSHNPADVKHLILIVRDCVLEQVVKYGDTYSIPLNNIQGPITLEFRPSPVQPNVTELQQATKPPSVVLYNQTAVAAPSEYAGRLSVSEKQVALHAVSMADEGSFTVLDRNGKVRKRNCLNVREHQNFLHRSYGETLKINLYLHHSKVSVVYVPDSDRRDRVILDQGVPLAPLDPLLEGRLSVEGSQLIVKKVRVTDNGLFKVTDLAGFPVAHTHLQVNAYKLQKRYVVILSLLGLIAFLLLLCLLSCLYKVHRRNEKNKKITLIAQQAGKGDGEAFRQVVHDAYTRFTEESQTQSTWDNATESTEVTIKGLEVSKPGRYQALASDKNFMEMSDSGVEFTISGLPLDSDTDVPMSYTSPKLLFDAGSPAAVTGGVHPDSPEATVVPDGDFSPASNPRSAAAAATPDGSLRGNASPGMASRGTAGSDLTPEGGAESGEAGPKEGAVQST